jgi:hypothetical protein
MLPLHRTINRIERRARRTAALHRLWDAGPNTTYAGLLAHAKARGWKRGWAYFAFLEIYSAPPRPQDRNVEPQSNLLVDEWASIRPHKSRKNKASNKFGVGSTRRPHGEAAPGSEAD